MNAEIESTIHLFKKKRKNKLLYNESKDKEQKYFCGTCLHGYSKRRLLEAHKPDCQGITKTAVRIEMPEPGENILKFQNHHKQLPAPFDYTLISKVSSNHFTALNATLKKATSKRLSFMKLVAVVTS